MRTRFVPVLTLFVLSSTAMAQYGAGDLPGAQEVLAEARRVRETDAQHGQALAILVVGAFLLRTLAQVLKEKYPDSLKLRRALPAIVAAGGAVSAFVAGVAAGLPWIDAVLVGLSGPLAAWGHDAHAGAVGFGRPPRNGSETPEG